MWPHRPSLEATLTKYQDPAEADKLMAIQKDLDETKAIMHDTIEAALERCARPHNYPLRARGMKSNLTGTLRPPRSSRGEHRDVIIHFACVRQGGEAG